MTDAESIELTDDDRKNGWTEKTLAAYIKERTAQKDRYANDPKLLKLRKAKIENVDTFNPHKWGR
jgi:predicted secreted protein